MVTLTTRTVALRRVVVTGMGTVNPLGNDVATSWTALMKGVSGIDHLTRYDITDHPVKIGGQVKGFDPLTVMDRKNVRRWDPVVHFAVAAALQAVENAGLKIDPAKAFRTGTLIGSGMGGMTTIQSTVDAVARGGLRKVSPLFIPQVIPNTPAGVVSMLLGTKGPNVCISTACATGTHSIGEAYRTLQLGEADVMIAGGAEAPLVPMAMAGFGAMRATSRRADDPTRASRPFDANRDGFVGGEGAGIVVLESLEHALERGAPIHAEVLGYGKSADAFHITAPAEDGGGACLAMSSALADADLGVADVDYINAHGTSTIFNDAIETLAIRSVFGEHADRLAVSSTKSMTGHMLGAAGGFETIVAVLAIREGWIPPTTNYETPDPACDLDYVPNEARRADVRVALNNSFGFGGTNATLIVGAYEGDRYGEGHSL